MERIDVLYEWGRTGKSQLLTSTNETVWRNDGTPRSLAQLVEYKSGMRQFITFCRTPCPQSAQLTSAV